MPKTKISEFSSTPANNTDIDSINIAEGCAPSGINDAIRELMAQLKDWQSGTSNDPMVIGSSGSLTLNQGTANGVTYLNGSKVVTSGSALTFDGTNLGVGVSSPNQLLDVRGANGIGIRFLETSTGNTNRVQLGTGSGFGYIDATAGSGSTALAFQVASSEQMRLTSTGLGIGTSSPSNPLHIVSNTVSQLNVAALSGNTNAQINLEPTGTGIALIGPANNVAFAFRTNATERLRISADGNLGLGVTPSAWSVFKAFDIGTVGGLSCDNGGTFLTKNAYDNTGSGGWKYKTTATASLYLQQAGGAHAWYTAPSGTAGNTITFTQAMTLDASGRLLVGLTSSSSGGPIQALVNGTGTSFQTNPAVFGAITTTAGREVPMIYGTDGTNSALVSMLSGNMGFFTQATERARIDSSGNLLVGTTTTTSGARLVVKGSGTTSATYNIYSTNSAGSIVFATEDGGTTYTGTLGNSPYNNTTGSAANMVVNAAGVLLRSTSSLKYKKDVQSATHGLAEVLKLRPVTYKGKSETDGNRVFGGLIAEEVHSAGLTEFVQYAEDGTPDALAYGNMVSLCIKAIQELKAEFDAYKASHP